MHGPEPTVRLFQQRLSFSGSASCDVRLSSHLDGSRRREPCALHRVRPPGPRFRPSTWFLGCRHRSCRSPHHQPNGACGARKAAHATVLKLHGGHADRLTRLQISGPDAARSAECGYAPSILFPPSSPVFWPALAAAQDASGFQSGYGSPADASVRAGSSRTPCRRRRFPLATSIGRRNTCVKFFCRRLKRQRFAWPTN